MRLYNFCEGVSALRIAVGIIMVGLLLAGSANAATLTVCESGCVYSSIQAAINASSSGGTILVQSGTYYENVNVTKQLTLRGIGMPVVDANGSGSAIMLSADGIELEGFTATGTRRNFYLDVGIGVFSNNNMIIGNNISNNGGGGIFLYGAATRYEGTYLYSSSNNNITGNNASNNNYGISLESSSNSNIIYNNYFSNTNNVLGASYMNTWNTTRTSGTNIICGPYLGGNVWANPYGTGFSQTCQDADNDGICDSPYILNSNNTDYLPLAYLIKSTVFINLSGI